MTKDPGTQQPDELKATGEADAATEQATITTEQENAQESAGQDKAMEVQDAEEGSTEG